MSANGFSKKFDFVSFTFSVFVAEADGIPAGWNWVDQIHQS